MPGIVVGVDNSTHSQHALDWAMAEAGIRKASLTVIAVHEVITGWLGHPTPGPEDLAITEHVGKTVQQQVDATLANLGEPRPVAVEVKAAAGGVSEEILRAAQGADMIVLGSRGAGGFARLMLGSVSMQVTLHAHCPVVIIPPEDRN